MLSQHKMFGIKGLTGKLRYAGGILGVEENETHYFLRKLVVVCRPDEIREKCGLPARKNG